MNYKWIIIGGIAVLALGTWGFVSARKKQAGLLVDKLKYRITPRGIRIGGGNVIITLDISIRNTTSQDFSVSSGNIITAKGYRVYLGEKLLAFGPLNMSKINLPAFGSHNINGVEVEIPIIELAGTASALLTNGGSVFDLVNEVIGGKLKSTLKNINWEQEVRKLRYEIDVEAFGATYHFKNNVF